MNITAPLVSNPKAAERMQPAERSFDYPGYFAKALIRSNAAPGNPHCDAALAQPDAVASVIVAFIAMQFCRALAGPTRKTAYGWQRSDQRLQHA